jgi:hypothetical protein
MMKTSNVWRCSDCHKVGFYFDMSDAQIREKHAQECENMIGEYRDYFSLPVRYCKKKWVPSWFWNLITDSYLADEAAAYRAEAAAVELAKTIDAGVADGSLHLNTMNEVFGKDGE